MKKYFSKLAVLLLSTMIFMISCSNASQITFVDENRGKFTDDGRAELKLRINSMTPTSKAIFPDSWTDENAKTALFYEVSYYVTGANTDTAITKDISYEDLKAGTASIELEPNKYSIFMTAYQGTAQGTDGKAKKDTTKAVLKSATQEIDLTTGSTAIDFDLKVVDNKSSTGEADIIVKFFNDDIFNISKVELEIVEKGASSDPLPSLPPKKTVSKEAFNTNSKTKITTIQLSGKDITPGEYWFKATFYTELNANGDVAGADSMIALTQETLYIDGGNISRGNINLSRNAFNSKPAKVTDFKANVYFDPAVTDTAVLLGNTNNEKGQVLGSTQEGTPNGVDGKYFINFTWTDNAENEAGYELALTDTTSADPIILTTDTTDNSKITGLPSGITLKVGNLAPGSNSITLEFTTGKFYKAISIVAVNNLVKEEADKEPLRAKIDLAEGEALGMFTVAYNINNGRPGSGFVQYSFEGNTLEPTKDYFVKAYHFNKDAKQAPITTSKALYPYVDSADFIFGGWYANKNGDALTPVNELKNENKVLYASWTRKASVRVTYPNYDDYRNLKLLTEQVPDQLMFPDVTSGIITVTIPPVVAPAKISDIKFAIDRVEGTKDEILALGVPGAEADENGISYDSATTKLTWDTDTFVKGNTGRGGIYRIFISYNYSPDGEDTSKKLVDGCVFVKLDR